MKNQPTLPLLQPGDEFPPLVQAWPANSPAPGLLAVGGTLDVSTLLRAYASTVFPWFSIGEPILWWSPDPRMVLSTRQFRLHRSLRRTLQRFVQDPHCRIGFDTAFTHVISACARKHRRGQTGTWIGPDMLRAYQALHWAGHAHSVETWVNDRLVAGLYCVNVGRAVFGESMFTDVDDGSKIALAALVAWCLEHAMPSIDCQQNTPHLASLGAREVPRAEFAQKTAILAQRPSPRWTFDPLYWNHLLPER